MSPDRSTLPSSLSARVSEYQIAENAVLCAWLKFSPFFSIPREYRPRSDCLFFKTLHSSHSPDYDGQGSQCRSPRCSRRSATRRRKCNYKLHQGRVGGGGLLISEIGRAKIERWNVYSRRNCSLLLSQEGCTRVSRADVIADPALSLPLLSLSLSLLRGTM